MRSLKISQLAFYLGLASRGLYEKAQRQQWPYSEEPSRRGKPKFIYSLETLPDDLQIAWANWDSQKFNIVFKSESEKSDGKPGDVPEPTSFAQAEEALTWPLRTKYYLETAPRKTRGPKPKIYDGVSRGLCIEAREILSSRFSSFVDIKANENKKEPDRKILQVQPQIPPRKEWGEKISFNEIEKPSKICPECDFGTYIAGHEDYKWCPICVDKVLLIENCPECGKAILSPFYNGCPYCGARFRQNVSVLPPEYSPQS